MQLQSDRRLGGQGGPDIATRTVERGHAVSGQRALQSLQVRRTFVTAQDTSGLAGFLLNGRLDTSGLAGQLEKARKEIGRLRDRTGRSSSTTRRRYTILRYAMLYYTIHPLLTKCFRPCEVEKWFFAHPRDKSFVALGRFTYSAAE